MTSPEITRVVPVLSLPPLVVSPVSSYMGRGSNRASRYTESDNSRR